MLSINRCVIILHCTRQTASILASADKFSDTELITDGDEADTKQSRESIQTQGELVSIFSGSVIIKMLLYPTA